MNATVSHSATSPRASTSMAVRYLTAGPGRNRPVASRRPCAAHPRLGAPLLAAKMVPSVGGRCPWPTSRGPRRAPRVLRRRRRLRREPPGHGARRAPAVRLASVGAHQRPRQDRARPGPVHPPPRRERWVGDRRHHRVVARARAVRRHAQRIQHAAGGRRPARADRQRCHRRGRHRRAGGDRRSGPGGPLPAREGVRRRRRSRAVP